jgi:hypothetical protein
MPCPENDGCVEICNTADNPIPVEIISTCLTQGVTEWIEPTGTIYQLPGSTYNTVTVAVTAGPVTVTMNNTGPPVSRTLPTGATFTASAGDCKLLLTGYTVDATGGSVLVSTFK